MPKLTGKNILVTGGAGFIGSHLVDRVICEKPKNLVIVDNLSLGKEENLLSARKAFPKLKFYQKNVSSFDSMERIIKKEMIEVVFNLAVVPLPASLVKPLYTFDTNIKIVSVLCELLRKKYYQTLIHFSSSEVYGSAQYMPMDEGHPLSPMTPYAASKAACDHLILSYRSTFGIDTAILRPFNNFGPRQNDESYAGIIPSVLKRAFLHKPIQIFGSGKQTRDFIYVTDVAKTAVDIYERIESRGRIINIASGKETSINQLVAKILKILNIDLPVEYLKPRPADVKRHFASVVLAKKLIDFTPAVNFDDGLKKTVNWYKNRK